MRKQEQQLALLKKIETDNAIFTTLDNAGKIVKIAEDCITRVKMKQIKSFPGQLVGQTSSKSFMDFNASIKTTINNNPKFVCHACAKGGLFLSYIGRVNDFNFSNLDYGNQIENNEHKRLLEIFTAEQLALIEFAFEGVQYLTNHKFGGAYRRIEFDAELTKRIKDFFKKHGGIYSNGEDGYPLTHDQTDIEGASGSFLTEIKRYFRASDRRLIAICKNIIKNNGIFIP